MTEIDKGLFDEMRADIKAMSAEITALKISIESIKTRLAIYVGGGSVIGGAIVSGAVGLLFKVVAP